VCLKTVQLGLLKFVDLLLEGLAGTSGYSVQNALYDLLFLTLRRGELGDLRMLGIDPFAQNTRHIFRFPNFGNINRSTSQHSFSNNTVSLNEDESVNNSDFKVITEMCKRLLRCRKFCLRKMAAPNILIDKIVRAKLTRLVALLCFRLPAFGEDAYCALLLGARAFHERNRAKFIPRQKAPEGDAGEEALRKSSSQTVFDKFKLHRPGEGPPSTKQSGHTSRLSGSQSNLSASTVNITQKNYAGDHSSLLDWRPVLQGMLESTSNDQDFHEEDMEYLKYCVHGPPSDPNVLPDSKGSSWGSGGRANSYYPEDSEKQSSSPPSVKSSDVPSVKMGGASVGRHRSMAAATVFPVVDGTNTDSILSFYYEVVEQWFFYVLDTLAVLHNPQIYWSNIPGFSKICEALVTFIGAYPHAANIPAPLKRLTFMALSAQDLINPFMHVLFLQTNVHRHFDACGALELLESWFWMIKSWRVRLKVYVLSIIDDPVTAQKWIYQGPGVSYASETFDWALEEELEKISSLAKIDSSNHQPSQTWSQWAFCLPPFTFIRKKHPSLAANLHSEGDRLATSQDKDKPYRDAPAQTKYEMRYGVNAKLLQQLPPQFDYTFFRACVIILMQVDHRLVTLKSLQFLYNCWDMLSDKEAQEVRRELIPKVPDFFLHWDPDIRQFFHYLLAFKLIDFESGNRNGRSPNRNGTGGDAIDYVELENSAMDAKDMTMSFATGLEKDHHLMGVSAGQSVAKYFNDMVKELSETLPIIYKEKLKEEGAKATDRAHTEKLARKQHHAQRAKDDAQRAEDELQKNKPPITELEKMAEWEKEVKALNARIDSEREKLETLPFLKKGETERTGAWIMGDVPIADPNKKIFGIGSAHARAAVKRNSSEANSNSPRLAYAASGPGALGVSVNGPTQPVALLFANWMKIPKNSVRLAYVTSSAVKWKEVKSRAEEAHESNDPAPDLHFAMEDHLTRKG